MPEFKWPRGLGRHQFYIAGPLFTDAEKAFNLSLYDRLDRYGYKCFLPQLTEEGSPGLIYRKNYMHLMLSNNVIAICDGPDVDAGTAWECGKFHKRGEIYGLRTDIRKSADDPKAGINLMISQSCTRIFTKRAFVIAYILKRFKPGEVF
jgi:nucleoside 2-deoxyribosyltransferase